MTRIEYRTRRKGQPEFRLVLGDAETKAEERRLRALRETCKALAKRGEWDVLRAVKNGAWAIEAIDRLVSEHGWAHYRAHLDFSAPTAGVPTLAEHGERWLASVEHEATRGIYARDFGRLCDFEVEGEPLGERPWHEVYPHEIADAIASVGETLAKNTVRTCLGGWGAFYTWAVKRERSEARAEGRAPRIDASPVRQAGVWGKPKITRHRFFRPFEIDELLAVAIEPMRAQYATLVYTGMRIGEFMALPPEHVRLPAKISVGPWGTWSPKNERGTRDIPVHRGKLLPLLETYRAEWAGERRFFVNPTHGEPWTYSAFTSRMRTDVEAAGMVYGQRVNGEVQPDGVTPHTFRHTLATWLCQADTQLTKIAAVLGDTVEVVANHYAHHLPTDLDRAINQL